MIDGFFTALQFVITWSSVVGLALFPIAIACLCVTAVSPTRRLTAGRWALRLVVWPWHLYLWTLGAGVLLSGLAGLGWWALLAAPLAGLFIIAFGVRIIWVGIIAIATGGQWRLAGLLAALAVALVGWHFVVYWAIARHGPPDWETT